MLNGKKKMILLIKKKNPPDVFVAQISSSVHHPTPEMLFSSDGHATVNTNI